MPEDERMRMKCSTIGLLSTPWSSASQEIRVLIQPTITLYALNSGQCIFKCSVVGMKTKSDFELNNDRLNQKEQSSFGMKN